MAWEKPKTDWQTGDVPTADAFNRIEKNILDLKDNKRDKSSTVPVANGGTGATNKNRQKISPEQRSGQNIRQKIENNKSN